MASRDHTTTGVASVADAPRTHEDRIASLSEEWAKRRELGALSDKVARLRHEIRLIEQARERSRLRSLPPHQRRVLAALVDDYWSDETYFRPFCTIARWAGLHRAQVSRACKALRRLGFMEYGRGLFTEDGEVAGSGYRITQLGHDWWHDREKPPADAARSAPQLSGDAIPRDER